MKKVKFPFDAERQRSGVLEGGGGNTVVLFSHGFTADKDSNTLFSIMAQSLKYSGLDSFRFDYTGCGDNPEEPLSFSEMYVDLEESLGFLQDIGYQRFYAVGHSLGCSILLNSNMFEKQVFLAPYVKSKHRHIAELEHVLGSEDVASFEGFFGRSHTITKQFLENFKNFDKTNDLIKTSTDTHIILAMEDYYTDNELITTKSSLNNNTTIEIIDLANHFFSEQRQPVFKSVKEFFIEKNNNDS